MKKYYMLFFIALVVSYNSLYAQNKAGIHFQAIARNNNGLIIADKKLNIKMGLYTDSVEDALVYEEIKSVKTNVLGLFFVDIGKTEEGKLITTNSWDKINWEKNIQFIKISIDPENDLQFVSLGFYPISASPYALYAYAINAVNINGTISLAQGGTGTNNLKDLKALLGIDKINNTPDSLKPITKSTFNLINEKLNSVDTISLSNRLNLKLNKLDTIYLSNRINQKLNKSDTIYLSNRIQALSQAIPSPKEWGMFYDTSRQITSANTATAINWNFAAASNTATITTNTSGQPTRLTIQGAGIYKLYFKLQFIKSDATSDEISIWIRKNSAAYPNTHQIYTINGGSIKNSLTGNYFLEMGERDYIELYYSVKNTNAILMSSPALISPSRPSIPAAYIMIEKIN
jgi:hypothetical protein